MVIIKKTRKDGVRQRYHVKPSKKRLKYKKIGVFHVARDSDGTFQGSKVIPFPKSKQKQINLKTKRRMIKRYSNTKELDTDYFLGRLPRNKWLEGRKKLMGV